MFRARIMADTPVRLIFDPYSPVLGSYPGFWTHLSCDYPSFVKDQALHVIGEIDEHDLGFSTLNADGAGFTYRYDQLNRETAMRHVGGGYIKNAIYNNRGQIRLLGIGSTRCITS